MKNDRFWKRISTAIIIAGLCLSCESSTIKKTEQVKAAENQNTELNVDYGELIIKEKSDYLMIPVYVTVHDQNQEDKLNFSRSYERANKPLYNIIFYHKQDGISHLLLNQKAIINSFDFLETKTSNKPPTRFWVYKILEQDTNQDKKLNSEDAVIGYLSDLSGKNLQQITPNNSQIINWVVVASQNALFIKILKDSNNDKKFTEKDKTNFIRVNLDQPGMGTEIISDQIEQQIKSYHTP
ncbi:hypothetical protein I8748_05210 [Nostoc sp. CENA67]|uniref:Uncharacterized protein n=1 Tax=Amazonocrinis nigriterrae CENA67 TaxID=2794033 RepID=A0A8J7HLS3_9NOST|nr:hypothetical protein [Amazonocrinis nigriterrae]MBH8561582.1 hypothetical protein [Amazonocrinis nigriterrae CENA67]